VIAASYSGNTEEVLSMLSQAEQRGASIAVIAAGGKLEAIAQEKGYLLAVLPKVVQARYAVLYNFRALLDVLVRIGLLKNDEIIPVLGKATKHLGVVVDEWQPIVPTARNPAKQLAQELLGKSVVTYGGPKMFPAAYKWKTAVNENAKQLAWAGCMPEYNHSEFIGWSKQPIDKPYAVVELRSSYEHPRVQKRFVVSNRLLSGVRPEPLVVESQGANAFEHLLYLLAYGDFVTLYLGLLNGLDPTPVALVENLKKEMDA
jgi:glucose/mannose-6-phosphate isomerase